MELAQSAIQYASWPLVTLVALFVLRKPLGKLLSNLRSVKAGSLEVAFGEQLQNQGFTDDQFKAIQSLTASEVDLFLLVSYSDSPTFKYDSTLPYLAFKNAMLRLQSAGLIKVSLADDANTHIHHSTTSVGHRIRAMLINSTVSLLHASP